jgi:hypothetical protein
MNKKYTYVFMNVSENIAVSIPNLSVVVAASHFARAMDNIGVVKHHEVGESIYYKTQTLFIAVIQQMEA